MNKVQIIITAGVLAVFSMIGVGILALIHGQTAPIIEEQTRVALAQRLKAVLPADYDNDPVKDTRELSPDPLLGGKAPATLYLARKAGEVRGLAFRVIAPNGYNGAIHLLIGMDRDGRIVGVRVISHRETPGLGDLIEEGKSNWIQGFVGKSLNNPTAKGWAVKKDGGVFDQFTGATITPRAVVQAVHRTLQYFDQHRAELLGGA